MIDSNADDVIARLGERRTLSRDAHEEALINAAAQKAVRDVFFVLGVDVNDPESVREFQSDMQFARQMRKILGHGVFAAIGALAVAAGAFVWSAILRAIGGGE